MGTNPFEADFSFADYAVEIDQYTPSVDKTSLLAESVKDKVNRLNTKTSAITRSMFSDADTFRIPGESSSTRLGEASGTYAQAPESPWTIENRKNREVTDEDLAKYYTSKKVLDNYAAGVVGASPEAIQDLVDNPLTPQNQELYDRYIKETQMQPMEATGVEGHTGYFGRPIAQVQNPTQEDTLQERLVQSGIAPELQGTSAITEEHPSSGLYAGAAPSDTDGMVGESVDIAQSSLIQEWGKVNKAVVDSGRWLGEKLGVDEETMKSILPDESGIFGKKFSEISRQEVADKMAGVMAKTREEQQKGMQNALENIKKGNYLDASFDTFKILPYMLGDSAGEMAAIAMGAPGITLAVAARVNEDAETYEKNNGKKPDAEWMLGSTLLNAGALFGEKFLIKSGVGSIVEKGVSKAKRTGGIVASAVGEAAQEYYDQVQQEYMTQKEGEKTLEEIATSPEAQLGALAGGVMGGALRGTGEAGGVAVEKVLQPSTQRIQDELEKRREAKAELDKEVAQAEQEEGTVAPNLTTAYGDVDTVKAKEVEYQTGLDEAITSGDTSKAIGILQQYNKDISNDSEGILDKQIFANKAQAVIAMAEEHAENLLKQKDDKAASVFGSSPEMIDAALENKTAEEATKYLEAYSNTYGSEADGIDRIKQNIEIKKSLEEVGDEIAIDIKNKTNAIKNATTPKQKEAATLEFERFQQDRTDSTNRLNNWISGLEREVNNEVEKKVAKGVSREDALKELLNDNYMYTSSDVHTTEVRAKKSDIARKLLDSNYVGGIYKLSEAKQSEVKAYNNVAKSLGIKAESKLQKAKEETSKEFESISQPEEKTKTTTMPTKSVTSTSYAESKAGEEVPSNIEDIKVRKRPLPESKVTTEKSMEKIPEKKEVKAKSKVDYAESKEGEYVPKGIEDIEIANIDDIIIQIDDIVKQQKEITKIVNKEDITEEEIDTTLTDAMERLNEYKKLLDRLNSKKIALKRKIDIHKNEVSRIQDKMKASYNRRKEAKSPEVRSRLGKIALKIAESATETIIKFRSILNRHKAYVEVYGKLLTKTEEKIKETEQKVNNFVSNEIIENSKLQKDFENILTTKRTSSKIASNPEAGIQLSKKLRKLNKVFNIDIINDIIEEKFSKLKNKDNNKEIALSTEFKKAADHDPARVLFNKEGKLHPNVVAAISKSLVEYLLKYGVSVLEGDPKQVANMLGYGDSVESVSSEALELLRGKVFKKNLTDTLGKIIMNDLGLKVDPEAEVKLREEQANPKSNKLYDKPIEDLSDKLVASIGQIAAIIGGELGIFTELDSIDSTNQITLEKYAELASNVKVPEKGKDTTIDLVGIGGIGIELIQNKDMYTVFNEIVEEFTEGTYLKEVKTKPISNKKEIKQKVDAQVYDVPETVKNVIKKGRKQAWRLDLEAVALFKRDDLKDVVKKFLGYKETKMDSEDKPYIPELAYTDSQNQIAKNNAIELKLRLLDNLIGRLGNQVNNDLFYDYFYGSNGRFYLDNNEVNPQNDTFNRFMMGLASNEVEVDLTKDTDSTNTFYIALAQAFGEDIDKMSIIDSVKAGKKYVSMGYDELIEKIKDPKFKPEAIGHALQGALAVKSKQEAKGKPFKTNLVIETDAVTSGIILKLLQMPLVDTADVSLEKVKELLKKGGIVFEGDVDYDTFKGTNELIANGQLDLYRTIAQEYGLTFENYIKEGNWKLKPNKDAKLTSGQIKINERRENILNATKNTGIMPVFETEGEKIKGPLRSIFKPVVMVFGYGGGIESIKRKFISEIVEALPTRLLEERLEVQKAIKDGLPKPETPVLNLFKTVNPNMKITLNMIRKQDILAKKVYKDTTIRDVLMEDMVALYGNNLEVALKGVFGEELLEANKALNNSFRMMFRIFNYKYQKRIKAFKKFKGYNPTAEDKANIILNMKKEFPAVTPPLAKDNEKGVIVDSKVDASVQITAQTMGNFTRGKGQDTISVAAVVKEFEEAISAGNVVPIHYIDASIMAKTFLAIDGIAQVFDAIIGNMDNAKEANTKYNEEVLTTSMEYSLTEKVLESLNQSVSTLTDEEAKEFLSEENSNNDKFTIESFEDGEAVYFTFKDIVNSMTNLKSKTDKIRNMLFSKSIKSDHMTGLGAVVELNSNGKIVKEKPKTESKSTLTKAERTEMEKSIKEAYRNINKREKEKGIKPKKETKTTSTKELKGRALEVAKAAEIEAGGDEDAAKVRVSKMFKKDIQLDEVFRDMSDEDLQAYEEYIEQTEVDMLPAVDTKDKNAIIPDNKAIKRARENALKKECK